MNSSASELAAKINLGWNIGNTLEAIGGETAWGNPYITKSYVEFVKQKGFNAIRLPCSWNQYADAQTAQIKSTWLDRVKEVVQYCIDNDMYVILNIHWDGGWLEENCTTAKQQINNARQKAFWQQIATRLRDFDEHLLFASANEPNVSDATQMQVLLSYHQTFINAVRSTGGKNAFRVLVVQGPGTDIEKTNNLMTKLPVDQVPNRMMVEVHYYTPWNFTGMMKDESWGNMFYYWGKDFHSITDPAHNPTWGEESTVDTNFKLMKNQFVDKGIPVITLEGVINCSDACVISGYDNDGHVLLGYNPFMNVNEDHNEAPDDTGYFRKSNWHDGFFEKESGRILIIEGKGEKSSKEIVFKETLNLIRRLVQEENLAPGQYNGLAAHKAFINALETYSWEDNFEPYLNVMCNYKQYLDRQYAIKFFYENGRDDLAQQYEKITELSQQLGKLIPQDFSAFELFSDKNNLKPYCNILLEIYNLEQDALKMLG
jgi:hypothetical protein